LNISWNNQAAFYFGFRLDHVGCQQRDLF